MNTDPRDIREPAGARTTETVTTNPALGADPIAPTGVPITGRARVGMNWIWPALALLAILLVLWLLLA